MGIENVNPYWYDKNYKSPIMPKKKKYDGKPIKPLTKEEKKILKSRKKSLPWEL